MSRASRLLVAALLTAASSLLADGIPPRPNDRAIHDLSGTLGGSEIADLERRAETVLRSGAAVAVLVRFHRSDADETRDEARRLLGEWEVEREAGRADGVAIVVNLKESASPATRAAAELAAGALLPAVIVAGAVGVLARRRLGDGAALGGLFDLPSPQS